MWRSLIRWFTRNWVDTAEPGDPQIVPQKLPCPPEQAVERLRELVGQLSRWRVESVDGYTLHLTHRTLVFRFVDDITLRLEAIPGGSMLHARSQSRIGKGDLGQNRRQLLSLFRAIRRELGTL